MPEKFESRYFDGHGKFFIGDRLADGSPQNLIFVGDMESVTLEPNVERTDIIEKVTGNAGVGTSYNASVRYNLSVNMRSVKPEHLVKALQGAHTDITGASVTDERHIVQVGAFIPMKYIGLSAVSVTQDPDGTATGLTEDTDYKVHADHGALEILSGGALNDGDEIGVDYTHVTQSEVKADPANDERYCLFAGVNRADSDRFVRCEIYKVRFSPSSVSLITEGAQNIPLSGLVETDMQRAAGDRLFSWNFNEA